MNKISRKYYFQNISTLLIPFFFVTLSLVIVLQQYDIFSIKKIILDSTNITEALFNVRNAPLAVLIALIVTGFNIIRKIISKKSDLKAPAAFIIDINKHKEEEILSRKAQEYKLKAFFDSAFKYNKLAFIVGKSGSGKSLLVNEYKKNHVNILVFSAVDYINPLKLGESLHKIIEDKKVKNKEQHIVVFDQFEKASKKEAFEPIIDFLHKTKNVTIFTAFISREIDYIEILKKIKSKVKNKATDDNPVYFKYATYFFGFIEDEIKTIQNQLKSLLPYVEGEDKRHEYFDKLLNASSHEDDILMIEMIIAKTYFGESPYSADRFKEVLEKNDCLNLYDRNHFEKAKNLIIEEYFDEVFLGRKYPSSETQERPNLPIPDDSTLAMIILYAVCKYPDGLTLSDFKNLTFADEDTINTILNFLKRQKLINQAIDNPDSPYLITHDYLSDYLETYCSKRISEHITMNINFYCKKRSEKIKNDKSTRIHESSYYKRFSNKKISKFISCCMIVLCVAIFGICVMHEINGYNSIRYLMNREYKWNHTIHALTVLALGSAIFYIYHYLQYFAKIFLSIKCCEFFICVLLLLWGMAAVVLSLVFYELWVIWLAIEWIFIAILHFSLSRRNILNGKARIRLKEEGNVYVFIILVLIGMNITLPFLSDNLSPWIIMFLIFVCSTIRRHINTDWMLAKLSCFVD